MKASGNRKSFFRFPDSSLHGFMKDIRGFIFDVSFVRDGFADQIYMKSARAFCFSASIPKVDSMARARTSMRCLVYGEMA